MLKEIFVIANGILYFHYSTDPKTLDSDETILSSGLLTAIQNFSEKARTDALESFVMANEYFLFKKLFKSDKTLVGVYESHTPQGLAQESLNEISNLVTRTKILEDKAVVNLDSPDKLKLRNQISELIDQFFGTKEDAIYVNELLSKRTDIPLAFLLDASEKELITKFARPKPLFKPNQVNDYFLLSSTLKQVISRLELPSNFVYCTIKSEQYCVASVCSGKNISLVVGSLNTPEKTVLDVALNMCRYDSLNAFIGNIKKQKTRFSAVISHNGTLSHLEGKELPALISVFLLTAINNINNFFKVTTKRNFSRFSLFIKNGSIHRLIFERKNSTEDFIIRISDYS